MPVTLGWREIASRLALAVLAGALVGANRGEHGRPAGLRTTLLVCLAAAVAMIQANLLLGTAGKPPTSFVVLDVMRLPLGILSGVGFIGAGAILRRDSLVLGVTTAATLWFVTVLGLCFGGGQPGLGVAALTLGLVVLWGLKWAERHLPREHRATLTLLAGAEGPTEEEIRAGLLAAGFRVASWAVTYQASARRRELRCEVRWRGSGVDGRPPAFLSRLVEHPGVIELRWRP